MLPEGSSKRPSVARITSHIWMLPSREQERSNRPKDRRLARFPSFLTDTSDDAGRGFGPEGFTTQKWHTSPGIVVEDATATAAMEAIKTARHARKSAERAANEAREAENTAKLALAAALDEVALKAPLKQWADARGPSSSSLGPKPRRKLQEAGPPGDAARPPFHGGTSGGGKGAEGNGQLSPPPDKADFSRSRSSHSRRWHEENKSTEGEGMKSAAPRPQRALVERSDAATAMSAERKDGAAKHVSAKTIHSPVSDMSISSSVAPWCPVDVSSSRGCAEKVVSVVRQSVRFRSPPVVSPTTPSSRRASSVARGANRPAWGAGAKIARVSKNSAHGANFEPSMTVAKNSSSVEQSTVMGAVGIAEASVPLQVIAPVTTPRPAPSRPILIASSPIWVASAESRVKGGSTYSKAWSSSPGRLSAHPSSILKAARQRGASSAGRGIAFDISIPPATTRKPAASKAWLADDGGDQQQEDRTTDAAKVIDNSSASDISASLSLGNEPRPAPTEPADDSTHVETPAEAKNLSLGSSRRRPPAVSSSSSIPPEKHAQPMKVSSTRMAVTESQTLVIEKAAAGDPKGSGRSSNEATKTKAGALHPGGSPGENSSIKEAAMAQTECLKAPAEPRKERLGTLAEAAGRRLEAPRAQTNPSAMGLAEGVVQQPSSPGERATDLAPDSANATEVDLTAEPGSSKERIKVGAREQSEVSRTLPGELARGALSSERSDEVTSAPAVESAAPDLRLLRPTSEYQTDQWLESIPPQFSEMPVTWDKSSVSPPPTVTRQPDSFTQTQATIEDGGLSKLSAGESQPNLSAMQFESPAGSQAGSTSGESSGVCEGPFAGGREASPQKGKENKDSPIYSAVSELSTFVVSTTAVEPSPEPRAETVEQSMQTSKSAKMTRASSLKTGAKASEKASAYASRVLSETGEKDEVTKVVESSGEKIAVDNERAGNARGRRGARSTAAAHATQAPPSVPREAEETDAKDTLISAEAIRRHVLKQFGAEETDKSAQSEHTVVDDARHSFNIRKLAGEESIWTMGPAEANDNVDGIHRSFSVRDAILVHTKRLRGRVERRGRERDGATPDAGPRSRSLSVPRSSKSGLFGQPVQAEVTGEGEEGVAAAVTKSLPKRSSATVVNKKGGGDSASFRPRSRGFTRAVAKIFGKSKKKKLGQDHEEPRERAASAV